MIKIQGYAHQFSKTRSACACSCLRHIRVRVDWSVLIQVQSVVIGRNLSWRPWRSSRR